jgi:hypothetical protein
VVGSLLGHLGCASRDPRRRRTFGDRRSDGAGRGNRARAPAVPVGVAATNEGHGWDRRARHPSRCRGAAGSASHGGWSRCCDDCTGPRWGCRGRGAVRAPGRGLGSGSSRVAPGAPHTGVDKVPVMRFVSGWFLPQSIRDRSAAARSLVGDPRSKVPYLSRLCPAHVKSGSCPGEETVKGQKTVATGSTAGPRRVVPTGTRARDRGGSDRRVTRVRSPAPGRTRCRAGGPAHLDGRR